jgi:predicted metal-dependent HD superfamily phosphohydrolase
MLQQEFMAVALKYTANGKLAEQLWSEIESAYRQPDRYFHNLFHLDQLFSVLKPLESQVEDWDTLSFAVFYHDVVYDVVEYVTNNNNEDKSAELAEKALRTINYPAEKIERCKHHILATKKHFLSTDGDTNFLTDADLSILGQPWSVYETYRKNIRREYGIFPDSIYHAGRIKVLQHFQQMKDLYKTAAFRQQYETAAKENIRRELEIISFT